MPNLHFLQLQKIVCEISSVINDGYIRRVCQPGKQVLTLEIRACQQNLWLLFSLERGTTRCHLVETPPANPPSPLPFCQILRKYIQGGRITDVEIAECDRIVTLNIICRQHRYHLIAELWGSFSNLFLLDAKSKIIATINRHRGKRSIIPGEVYSVPVTSGKAPPLADDFLPPSQSPFAWNKAADIFYRQALTESQQLQKYRQLHSACSKKIKKTAKRSHKLRHQLQQAEDSETLKIWGELIKGELGKYKPQPCRLDKIQVTNYYQQHSPQIEIPLDPHKSMQQNMERYFKRYRKLNRGYSIIQEELTASEQQLANWQQLLSKIEEHQGKDIIAFWQRLPQHLQKLLSASSASKSTTQQRQPVYKFYTKDSSEILVGKNANDNETLTFRIARGNDWWLHTRDYPGSHVVIRSSHTSLSQETLLDAAQLAVYYSKARKHGKVTVTYTQRKYVSKAKRAKAGAVLLKKEKCLHIVPDSKDIQRILATRSD